MDNIIIIVFACASNIIKIHHLYRRYAKSQIKEETLPYDVIAVGARAGKKACTNKKET